MSERHKRNKDDNVAAGVVDYDDDGDSVDVEDYDDDGDDDNKCCADAQHKSLCLRVI